MRKTVNVSLVVEAIVDTILLQWFGFRFRMVRNDTIMRNCVLGRVLCIWLAF